MVVRCPSHSRGPARRPSWRDGSDAATASWWACQRALFTPMLFGVGAWYGRALAARPYCIWFYILCFVLRTAIRAKARVAQVRATARAGTPRGPATCPAWGGSGSEHRYPRVQTAPVVAHAMGGSGSANGRPAPPTCRSRDGWFRFGRRVAQVRPRGGPGPVEGWLGSGRAVVRVRAGVARDRYRGPSYHDPGRRGMNGHGPDGRPADHGTRARPGDSCSTGRGHERLRPLYDRLNGAAAIGFGSLVAARGDDATARLATASRVRPSSPSERPPGLRSRSPAGS